MAATRRLAFTAPQRMIHRVHCDAAYMGPLAQPPAATGLADRHVFVIEIANLSDRRDAVDVNLANLAGWHLDGGVIALASHQLHRRPGAPGNLPSLAWLELHVVDLRAERNVPQRQTVARKDVDVVAGDDRVTHFDAKWLQNVPLLALSVVISAIRAERFGSYSTVDTLPGMFFLSRLK